jgi:hypothetical protein
MTPDHLVGVISGRHVASKTPRPMAPFALFVLGN